VTVDRYAIIVFWSEDDRAWVADVPDLKSCAAFGSTPEEAFAQIRIAMEAWLAAARDAGLEIPNLNSSLIKKRLNDKL
jgi:predicted RNase H-like HicB family nuclease